MLLKNKKIVSTCTCRYIYPPPSRNSSVTVPVTRLLLGAPGPYRASSSAADRAGPLRGLGRSTACGAPGASKEQENCQYMYMQVHLPPPSRNSSETVPVSSLRLAAGRGAEEAAAVGCCPAGFTLVAPIVNAAAA